MLAWHFINNDYRLTFNLSDLKGKEGLEVGVSLPLELCKNGLHSSQKIIDAIPFAPGTVLTRVELSGDIIEDERKLCSQYRKILWMGEIGGLLEALYQRIVFLYLKELLSDTNIGSDIRNLLQAPIEVLKIKKEYVLNKTKDNDLCLQKTEKQAEQSYCTLLQNKSDVKITLGALWTMRAALIEEKIPARSKPLILGNLSSWLLELKMLPNSSVWLQKFEELTIQQLIKCSPELSQWI